MKRNTGRESDRRPGVIPPTRALLPRQGLCAFTPSKTGVVRQAGKGAAQRARQKSTSAVPVTAPVPCGRAPLAWELSGDRHDLGGVPFTQAGVIAKRPLTVNLTCRPLLWIRPEWADLVDLFPQRERATMTTWCWR